LNMHNFKTEQFSQMFPVCKPRKFYWKRTRIPKKFHEDFPAGSVEGPVVCINNKKLTGKLKDSINRDNRSLLT